MGQEWEPTRGPVGMRTVTDLVTVPPQLVRECKEVLKGGLLMKQYHQFMLLGLPHGPGPAGCNMDAFEEDLHKMLMVRARGACSPARFVAASGSSFNRGHYSRMAPK